LASTTATRGAQFFSAEVNKKCPEGSIIR